MPNPFMFPPGQFGKINPNPLGQPKGPGSGFLNRNLPQSQPPVSTPPAPQQGTAPTVPPPTLPPAPAAPPPPAAPTAPPAPASGVDSGGISLIQPNTEGRTPLQQYQMYRSAGGQMNYGDWTNAVQGAGGGGGGTPPPQGGTTPTVDDSLRVTDTNAIDPFFQQVSQLFPGLTSAGEFGFPVQEGSRDNRFNQAAGVFAGGPFQTDVDPLLSFIMSILGGQVGQQQGRAGEQEGILRQLIPQQQASSANALNESVLQGAQDLTSTRAQDALREKLVNQARAGAAGQENASINRLRDLGVIGQGGAATGAVNQAENLANMGLQKNLTDIEFGLDQNQQQRLGLAGDLAGRGADIQRSLNVDPQLMLADRLGRAFNPAVSGFTDFAAQVANLSLGHQFARENAPNDFQKLAPLLGGAVGAAGSLLSAPAAGGSIIAKLLGV